jgi:hypothetical protein
MKMNVEHFQHEFSVWYQAMGLGMEQYPEGLEQ